MDGSLCCYAQDSFHFKPEITCANGRLDDTDERHTLFSDTRKMFYFDSGYEVQFSVSKFGCFH
jgi:hypothetical protein